MSKEKQKGSERDMAIFFDMKLEGAYEENLTVKQWGNGSGIRLNNTIKNLLGVKNGSELKAYITSEGVVIKKREEPSLEELCAKITPENKHDHVDYGQSVGRELL